MADIIIQQQVKKSDGGFDALVPSRAINATLLQNVNFADDTKSQIGDYIISKAKILFHRDSGISLSTGGSSSVNIPLSEPLHTGDLIRVTYKSAFPNGERYAYVSIPSGGTMVHLCSVYLYGGIGSDDMRFIFTQAELTNFTDNSNSIKFDVPISRGMKMPSAADRNVLSGGTASDIITIFEIAKIIE